jgi:hypothetical protein
VGLARKEEREGAARIPAEYREVDLRKDLLECMDLFFKYG